MIANMKNKLMAKDDEYQKLQIDYHQQENKVIKFNHDLQILLESYNNISAENQQLNSENQTLYQQLQIEQIGKLQNKLNQIHLHHLKLNKIKMVKFNSNSVNLQSLVKRGKLLTEQCADLNVENNKLKEQNQKLNQQIDDLQQQMSLLNIMTMTMTMTMIMMMIQPH